MAAEYPNVKYPIVILPKNNLKAIIITRNGSRITICYFFSSNQLGLNIRFAQYPEKDSCKPEVLALFKVYSYKNNLILQNFKASILLFSLKF